MSAIQPPAANRAVFLSYAREDAIAARRIAEALRGFGVEVWFDQSELRGGDQWDAKIRGQLKACTLFIPVISQTTQSRDEAYFRLEWKLADDRSHLMAPGKAFIVPVIIDDTPDKGASVPDSFTRAQWTRLPDGEPDPEFIGLVKRLTSTAPAASPTTRSDTTTSPQPAASATPPKRKAFLPFALIGAGILACAAAGVAFLMKRGGAASTPSASTPSPVTEARPYIAGSLAVLPLKLLPGAEAWRDRADGLHEELLNQLSDMKPLELASRTSVLQYRDTTANLRAIGRELGVEFIVEGSVQKVGDEPRLTLQVIEVASDRHVSSQNFDYVADKTQDPAVQQKSFAFELALSIYRSLRAERPPAGESARLLAAATSRLKAESQRVADSFFTYRTVEGYRSLIELLTRFREIDPDNGFVRGHFALILSQKAYCGLLTDDLDPDHVREMSLALNQALLVDPDNFDALEQMGVHLFNRLGRPHDAVAYLRRVVTDRDLKNAVGKEQDAWDRAELAESLYKSGQAPAAVAVLEKVPKNGASVGQIARWVHAYRATRRPAELIAFLKDQKGHLSYHGIPTQVLDEYLDLSVAEMEVAWTGSPKPALSLYAKFKETPDMSPGFMLYLLQFTDHYQEMLDTLSKIGAAFDPMEPPSELATLDRITALRGLGNDTLARSYIQSLLKDIPANDPFAERRWGEQARYHALLGDRDAALKAIAASQAALDPQRDFFSYVEAQRQIAFAYAQLGLPAEACAAIDAVLSSPGDYLTGNFLIEQDMGPIRHSPEFEAIIRKHADQLKDPAILDTFFSRPGA